MKVSVKTIAEFVQRRRIDFNGEVVHLFGVGSVCSPKFRPLPIPFVECESCENGGDVGIFEIESVHSNENVVDKVGVKFMVRSHLAGNVVSFTRPKIHDEKC